MLSISHTLASLPFGVFTDNVLLALVGAFVFHLFCDSLLHWNIYPPNFKRYPYEWVALDVLGGVVAAWLLVGHTISAPSVLAAIVGGNLPDVLHGLWEFAGHERREKLPLFMKRFFYFHNRIQRETPHVARGLISQIIVVSLSVLLLTR